MCGAIHHPLSRLNYVGEIRADDLAQNLVAAEIGRHDNGLSFEELRSVLARDYLESSLRPKYIRRHIERCIDEGLIVVTVGESGIARYKTASAREPQEANE